MNDSLTFRQAPNRTRTGRTSERVKRSTPIIPLQFSTFHLRDLDDVLAFPRASKCFLTVNHHSKDAALQGTKICRSYGSRNRFPCSYPVSPLHAMIVFIDGFRFTLSSRFIVFNILNIYFFFLDCAFKHAAACFTALSPLMAADNFSSRPTMTATIAPFFKSPGCRAPDW